MKKFKKIILAFVFCLGILHAQTNLVPNPSFENYSSCTPQLMQYLNFWFPYFAGSPDCFNSCMNISNPLLGVPSNIFGYENPRTGNGYCGFGTYELGLNNLQEFVRVPLTSTLIPGNKYGLTFYLSLSDSSSYETTMFNAYFSVTNDTYSLISGKDSLMSKAQITATVSHGAISKTGWTKISVSYIAIGTENYLMLGNFQKNSQVDTLYLCYCQNPKYAYYYIDDVSLIDSTALQNIGENNYIIKEINTIFKNGDYFSFSDKTANSEITIVNSMGQMILKTKENFYVENFAPGIYFYIIESNKYLIKNKFLITQ